LRFNPLREILPWVAVAVGIFHTIRAATGAMDSIFLITGPILTVIGITGFLIARWMKKRGI
jgi:spore maturation protein SpmB